MPASANEPPTAHLINMQTALARALSVEDINQLGRDTGQSERLRTVTPHRLFLSTVTALAGRNVETLADLLREFNYQNDTTVACKAFYNRLARPGFTNFMRQMFARLVEQLTIRSLAPEGQTAVARFQDIVIQDGSSFALKQQLRNVFPGASRPSSQQPSRSMPRTAASPTRFARCRSRRTRKPSDSSCRRRRR